MNILYTAGYAGLSPHDLFKAADRLGAIVADIRFKPASRIPHWNKSLLVKAGGSRYVHLPTLGNRNYKGELGEGIMLDDVEAGSVELIRLLAASPVIILCACKDHTTCHRSTVAQEMIDRYGVEVVHLEAKDFQWGNTPQPRLL